MILEIENEVTVEMIHNDFWSANDNLLSLTPFEIDSKTIEKVNKLKEIGVSSRNIVMKEYEKLERKVKKIDKLIGYQEFIKKYNAKYPFLKVIDIDSIMELCNKYSLVLNFMGNYIGDIPDKNINEILHNLSLVSKDDRYSILTNNSWSDNKIKRELDLMIAAPRDLFENHILDRDKYLTYLPHGIEEFTVIVDDPIVLLPVRHNYDEDYFSYSPPTLYLILSAWGLEANDELVVNEKLN